MNIEHRTLNVQHRIMYSVNLIKDLAKRGYPSEFCGALVLKSVKRSVINIGRSMLDVRCSMFNLFTVPAKRSFIRGVRSQLTDDRWPSGLL